MPNAAVESELQEKEERQLGSMGLLQHLEELRKRVIYAVVAVLVDFLIGHGGDFKAVITITEYTDQWLTIILGLAIVFEVPIVIGFAAMMGAVDAKFLLKHIRGAVFLFFIVAAILTPTTDPLNMT